MSFLLNLWRRCRLGRCPRCGGTGKLRALVFNRVKRAEFYVDKDSELLGFNLDVVEGHQEQYQYDCPACQKGYWKKQPVKVRQLNQEEVVAEDQAAVVAEAKSLVEQR